MLNQIRQQFGSFWSKQSKIQRIVLVALVGTGLVLIPLFLTWASTPTYAVAFNGMSESDAGLIVEQLAEQNIPYQLRNSSTILVPSDMVYDVRLRMARQGLPQGGTVGFELFSGNTLGMTEFTQRVNYQQAMEGELERTIGSLDVVDAVRVHIVVPEKTLLSSEQAPATASVTVKVQPGSRMDASQVRSITHLVASSIEGLEAENVVVVDVNGNLLANGEAKDSAGGYANVDNHRAAEVQAARELEVKVQDILDKAMGPNKSVVQAQVTMDWTEREVTTQSFNPETAAVRSAQDVMETYTTTNGTLAGVPGAASNLPPADAGVLPEDQSVFYKRTETITNFELTEENSIEIVAPGNIERVSLSVLVDGVTNTQQLATLATVIGAAAGIDTTRGDILAVETLNFDRSYYETQATDLEDRRTRDLYIQIGQTVAVAILVLAILWYVQRLLSNLRLASSEAWQPVLRPVSDMGLAAGQGAGRRLSESSAGGAATYVQREAYPGREADAQENFPQPAAPPPPKPKPKPLPKYELPQVSPEEEQLLYLIQGLAEEDPATLANVLQLWLSEDERNNG